MKEHYLTRHEDGHHSRWALNGMWLPKSFTLGMLLELPANTVTPFLNSLSSLYKANEKLLSPIEGDQEVWASGVTYAHSRDARENETEVKDIYQKVYEAARPEIFFKSIGWRTAGHRGGIRIRKDTSWNVPEPEVVLVVNSFGEIVGYTAGNDVSSRDIEGENPLYLPQAKSYNGSCAIGPGILIADPDALRDLPIELEIIRNTQSEFRGVTRTSKMKRSFEELVRYLTMELSFPTGAFLMTGTGIIPPGDFTLQEGDLVRIKIDSIILENHVN